MSSHLYGGTLGGSLMPRRSFLGFRVTSMLMMAALLLAVASIPSAHAAAGVDSFDVSMWEYDDTGSLSRPPGARSPTLARTELPSMHCPGASFAPSLNSLVPRRGQTVLGKFPDYLNLADDLGARRFNIPQDVWARMTKAEQWTANRKFLDRMIRRGDDIILSNPVKNVNEVTGAFRQELDYLIQQGFRLSDDGTRLLR